MGCLQEGHKQLIHTKAHNLTSSFFFFNDPATTEIYTLSLHDALPISLIGVTHESVESGKRLFRRSIDDGGAACASCHTPFHPDRKSTRLNSSHGYISYAVFCLKKKKKQTKSRDL